MAWRAVRGSLLSMCPGTNGRLGTPGAQVREALALLTTKLEARRKDLDQLTDAKAKIEAGVAEVRSSMG